VRRRALVIVSVIAIVVLGALGAALAFMTDTSDDDGSAEPAPRTAPDPEAQRFVDPQGAYTLEIDPAWAPQAASRDVERWIVDAAGDSVTIETATVVDTDLDQYLQGVIEEAPDAVEDFRLREFRVITTEPAPGEEQSRPHQLGLVAYEGIEGGEPRGFYIVASVERGTAIVATMITDEPRFDATRASVEPFLLTLRPR
jgi:hypothetical protein